MFDKRKFIIILLSIIISIIFIFVVIPESYNILLYFNVDIWLIIVIITIMIPAYFGLTLWLLLTSIYFDKDKSRNKYKKNKTLKDKRRESEIEFDIHLVLKYIKQVLKEKDNISIDEIADVLDLDRKFILKVIKNFINEKLLDGYLRNGVYYKSWGNDE